jgi:hypothetical protein
MLHFVLFHNVTCYTNSIVSHIHVNTTKLYNITCTLVATCVILRSLECTQWFFFKERGAIKNYDNIQLLVEKFTFHNLNAPHKQTSQNEKRICLCDTSLCGTQPHTYGMLCMCHVPIGPFYTRTTEL